MSSKKIQLIHTAYGIVVSLLVILCGVLLIVACLDIYKSGVDPFTRQSIGEHFATISWAVYTLLAFILGGGVLHIALPQDAKRLKGAIDKKETLYKMSERMTAASSVGYEKIEKERVLRFTLLVISFVLILGASIGSFVYVNSNLDIYALIDGEEGTVDVNGQVLKGFVSILYFFLLPVIYTLVSIFVCKKSIERELSIVKSELSSKDTEKQNVSVLSTPIASAISSVSSKARKSSLPEGRGRIIIMCGLGILAVVFIVLGILNGGMQDVLTKAIAICRECIGMG